MQHVLITVGSLGVGGTENFVMNYYRNADRKNFQFTFYIFTGNRMEYYSEVISLGGKVIIDNKSKNNFERFLAFSIFIKKNKFDTVYCHSCSVSMMLRVVIPAKIFKSGKIIVHSHSMGTSKNTFIEQKVHFIMKLVLCYCIDYGFSCSDFAGKAKYTNRFIKSNRYVVIKNAINTSKYKFDPVIRKKLRMKYGVKDKLVIGNVGRLSEEKNQIFLLKIVKFLKDNQVPIVCVLVGDGELSNILHKISDEWEISENIIFLGKVDNVYEYYSMFDLLVMPSIFEGLPFTAIEAQVNGLRCLFSSSISLMANISGKCVYLSLEEPIQKWGQTIIENSKKRINPSITEKLFKEYNMANEACKIEYYLKIAR